MLYFILNRGKMFATNLITASLLDTTFRGKTDPLNKRTTMLRSKIGKTIFYSAQNLPKTEWEKYGKDKFYLTPTGINYMTSVN